MKKKQISIAGIAIFGIALLFSCTASRMELAAANEPAPIFDFEDEVHQASYLIGYSFGIVLGETIREMGLDIDLVMAAFREVYDGVPARLSDSALAAIDARMEQESALRQLEKEEKELAESLEFLKWNEKNEGVIVTESSLQYIVIREGDGPRPGPNDRVKTYLHGTLIDGTVFVSSLPGYFMITVGVEIPGLAEALQLMNVGSKFKLFIPPALAYYGSRGVHPLIKPHSVLIFEIELIGIEGKEAEDSPPAGPVSERRQRAMHIADSMDVKLLAGQVIFTAVPGKETLTPSNRDFLTQTPAGGITIFGYNLVPDPEKNRAFIEAVYNTIADITLPPFVASDQEGGSVQRIRGEASLPPPFSYWERLQTSPADSVIAAIESEAAQAGRELRRIGVTFNLAPVVEVLTDENQPFLKTRSYGSDQVFVTDASAAFIRGMDEAGIAATLKHFPGNTTVDPHYHMATLDISEANFELKIGPFRDLIRRENPASVMVSHVIVPSWDAALPLTRSAIATKKLRDMGFDGIIMADCFAMVASGTTPEAGVVEALAAGVDAVLAWPRDLTTIYKAILDAVEAGTLSEERLRRAAEQVIYQKIRYGLVR
ncbi:MAG: FKBP-type peptidyl-prolyl cis-trans isomerase [Chitinispirillales bacterium]|jgi:beta-glucosidase-like glycosyl hydrolase/FKBP-type peptidyl-prolyl cis-trans isomerase|nr:FKBP-type peptidyl-prolyl cis-trans isomerase [Chitinispirillales bacterium]